MRKRTFGRWATLLAVVAALGVGGLVGSSWLSSASGGHVLADINWQMCSMQSGPGEAVN
jgi:hypothetical protein